MINWALARRQGWRLLMRMEDLDGPRVKPETVRHTLDTLEWLGLDHDGDVVEQSSDLAPYRDALARLAEHQLVYRCHLTRREVAAAALSAPHADDHETRFPRALRARDPALFTVTEDETNYRLVVDAESVVVDDELRGTRVFDPAREVGDFVVWTRRGVPGYQLAVVVDDARFGVTDVVRGDDLLPSAARQQLIYAGLDATPPTWWHVPLVLGPDGHRLAKRHGDTRLARYREHGVHAERVVGLLARWCGMTERRTTMSAAEFRDALDIDQLPSGPAILTEEDERWLTNA